jgi:segregation and condensation protein A
MGANHDGYPGDNGRPAVLTEDYRVQLDAFEGPLDLLLYLIRKNEVDVHDIPVSTIAEQYMGFLTHIDRIDIDVAGEFLVMAATLMEVKSRMLTPTPKAVEGDTDGPTAPVADPRAELVRQLLAYKKYRDAATALEHRADEWRSRFGVGRAGIENSAIQAAIESAPEMDIHDLELIDLFEAFQRIAESVNFERLGEHQVQYDDTPIELHAEDIVDRLKRDAVAVESGKAELPFIGLFNGRTRSEMVGLFLAMLELCRRRTISFRQDETAGIMIRLRTEEEVAVDAAQRAEQEAREVPMEPEVAERGRRRKREEPKPAAE